MNKAQHWRRIVLWLGSFPAIAAFVLLIMVLMLGDSAAPAIPKKLDGSHPAQHGVQSAELESQGSESISSESP
ncbi:hypothetical protein [Pseudomonas lactis]|jgi:hypothetical protein|uniref:hypothetical protein n=1 Tax=Pseudomonas lactis TaxID=1615674 RepID=UPI00110C76D3|nr:hypothetical protein [Pseudomonas lactis]MBK3446344.1 hypothetical protein [Pseudomonas lactis]